MAEKLAWLILRLAHLPRRVNLLGLWPRMRMVGGERLVIGGRVGREVVIFVVLLVGLMEWWVVGVV